MLLNPSLTFFLNVHFNKGWYSSFYWFKMERRESKTWYDYLCLKHYLFFFSWASVAYMCVNRYKMFIYFDHFVLGVSYWDRHKSVVRRCRYLDLNIFSSQTAHCILTKRQRSDFIVIPCQVAQNLPFQLVAKVGHGVKKIGF